MAKIKLTKSVVVMAQVQTRDVKLGTQSFRASCARLHQPAGRSLCFSTERTQASAESLRLASSASLPSSRLVHWLRIGWPKSVVVVVLG